MVVVPDRIWKFHNVLPKELMDAVISSITSHCSEAQLVSSENTPPKFCYSGFHYLHLPMTEDLRKKVYRTVLDTLSTVEPALAETRISDSKLSYSSLFLKAFASGSFYHLHAEDRNVFGSLAYILYLSDESSGPIIFPSRGDLKKFTDSRELENWKVMENYLIKNDTEPEYLSQSLTLYPRKNQLLAFRIGLAHKVEVFSANAPGRFCFTGFPGATIP